MIDFDQLNQDTSKLEAVMDDKLFYLNHSFVTNSSRRVTTLSCKKFIKNWSAIKWNYTPAPSSNTIASLLKTRPTPLCSPITHISVKILWRLSGINDKSPSIWRDFMPDSLKRQLLKYPIISSTKSILPSCIPLWKDSSRRLSTSWEDLMSWMTWRTLMQWFLKFTRRINWFKRKLLMNLLIKGTSVPAISSTELTGSI